MKKIRNGFSMVELLMVMAVMAVLAAIAIPNMSASQDSAILTSMKSDASNAIAQLQADYTTTQDYSAISPEGDSGTAYSDSDNDGIADTALTTTDYFNVSKGNTITVYTDSTNPNNFGISVCNSGFSSGKCVAFNSNTNGKLVLQ